MNKQLYYLHLKVANSWIKNWQCMEHTVNAKLGTYCEKKKKTLKERVDRLKNTQLKNPEEKVTFLSYSN